MAVDSTVSTERVVQRVSAATLLVVALCWVTLVFDGYDLIVYGAVVPSLLADPAWNLGPAQVGVIAGYAPLGMLLGALIVGTLTDQIGRRRSVMLCASWFSVFMGLCAVAPSPEIFGLFRFLAGLGLGGVLPTVTALTTEYSPVKWRTLIYAVVFTGMPLGGLIAASTAIPLIPAFGWRAMFWIGLTPILIVVPLAYKYLPESVAFLLAKGRAEEAQALARRHHIPLEPGSVGNVGEAQEAPAERSRLGALRTLFSRNYLAATLLFWTATFAGLFMTYGLNIWLPQIMREAGYSLGSALSFLLVLNLGAIVGSMFTSVATDRLRPKPVAVFSFLLALASISLLSVQMPLGAVYAVVAVAGIGTHGTQVLVNAYVSRHYPADIRATALGWSLGIGRLGTIFGPVVGGLLLTWQLAPQWSFYVFSLPALLGATAILLLPRVRAERARPAAAAPETASQA